jgi:hypothetical protein
VQPKVGILIVFCVFKFFWIFMVYSCLWVNFVMFKKVYSCTFYLYSLVFKYVFMFFITNFECIHVFKLNSSVFTLFWKF